jgi:MFS family permease
MTVVDHAPSTGRRSIGRNFRLVWLSVLVSSTGDGMFVTAFPLLAVMLTRDPRLIAGVTIALRLPWLVMSMFTGAIADRFNRRRLMIIADVGRLVVVGVLGVAVLAGAANIWMLYVCAFLLTTGDTLHVNAAQALLPAIVQQRDLLQANARFGSAQIVSAQFVGPPLGVAAFGAAASAPFLADAVSFAGSAALVASLPDVPAPDRAASRVRDDLLEGIRFTWRSKAFRRIAGPLAVGNFFFFAATSLLVLYTDDHLGAGEVVYSLLFIGSAVGAVCARFMVSPLVRRFGEVNTMVIPLWLWSLPMLGMAATRSPVIAIAMYFFVGLGTGLWIATNTTVRQRITPPALLGRMNAVYRTVSWGVVPFGAAFGGFVAHEWGLLAPFVIAGVACTPLAVFGRRILAPVGEAPAWDAVPTVSPVAGTA